MKSVKKNSNTQKIKCFKCEIYLSHFVRVFRIYYLLRSELPTANSCQTFSPIVSERKAFGNSKYETVEELKKRQIVSFIKYNRDVEILNIEIIPIPTKADSMLGIYTLEFIQYINCIRKYFRCPISLSPDVIKQQSKKKKILNIP